MNELPDLYEVPEDGIDIFSWCPTPKPTVPPTQVHLHLPTLTQLGIKFFLRFKSPRTLDRLIDALKQHREDVWGKRVVPPEHIEFEQYVDDMRDDPVKALRIYRDEQGDLYVSIGPPGDKFHPNCIRLCASGGADTAAPAFFISMQKAFDGLKQRTALFRQRTQG